MEYKTSSFRNVGKSPLLQSISGKDSHNCMKIHCYDGTLAGKRKKEICGTRKCIMKAHTNEIPLYFTFVLPLLIDGHLLNVLFSPTLMLGDTCHMHSCFLVTCLMLSLLQQYAEVCIVIPETILIILASARWLLSIDLTS